MVIIVNKMGKNPPAKLFISFFLEKKIIFIILFEYFMKVLFITPAQNFAELNISATHSRRIQRPSKKVSQIHGNVRNVSH